MPIVRDEQGLIGQHDIFDRNYLDFGDCARSEGIMATFGSYQDKMLLPLLHKGRGILIRHNKQTPWNNSDNYSRDQLICYLAGLAACKDDHTIEKIFWAHVARAGLCQNGDLTNPAVFMQMILGARLWALYWFLPLGYLWHFLELIWFTKIKPNAEVNQFICQAKQFGTAWMFKKFHPDYRMAISSYFSNWRNQPEISAQILDNF